MRAFVTLLAGGMIFAGGLSVAKADDKPQPKKEDSKATALAEKMFKDLDKDKDGKLTKDEFLARSKDMPAVRGRQELFFKNCDKDKDGSLTLEELKEGMQKRKD